MSISGNLQSLCAIRYTQKNLTGFKNLLGFNRYIFTFLHQAHFLNNGGNLQPETCLPAEAKRRREI
ncbi:MAG: hypothetical protein B6D64_01345 [Bacteroidetes bacterium 4484_276]|nr:MAG: hypothetical protein B6D64_01345 [Bacteroidetes bacterium 4484_276]